MRALVLGALALTLTPAAAGAAPVPRPPPCQVRTSIYAMIDDSISLGSSDPAKLRVEALKQLKLDPDNLGKRLGAMEFASEAQPLFPLLPIRTRSGLMDQTLGSRIAGNDGATNYNAAFALAAAHGAEADRVMLLTDGGQNEGVYLEGHRLGKAIDVIGVGSELLANPVDDARLARIAAETGGLYRKAQDLAGLRLATNEINAAINCRRPPVTFADRFNRPGQSRIRTISTGPGDRSVHLSAIWAMPNDAVDLTSFTLSHTVIRSRARRRPARTKLRAIKRTAAAFTTIKVRLPRKRAERRGKLTFRVRANTVANPAAGVQVTTQASRSPRR